MKYSKDILEKLVSESKSYSEVTTKLGLNNYCGNRQTIKKYIEVYGLDISHFGKYNSNINGSRNKKCISEILVENSTYSNTHLKKRLINDGVLEYSCQICGNIGEWNGNPMSLQLDHINGVNNDNRLENLRFLCPNCHSQTNTYGGKNVSYDKTRKTCVCGKYKDKNSKMCNTCTSKSNRKVDRPSYEVLMVDIQELGYTGTGSKYGVSDNAIRKWKKYYEKNKE